MAGFTKKLIAGFAAASLALTAGVGIADAGSKKTKKAAQPEATQIVAAAIPDEVAQEVKARFKKLAPIVRNSHKVYEALGYDKDTQEICVAQGHVYVQELAKLSKHPDYSYAIANASMEDLEAITRFAYCILPEGKKAILNTCSTFGMALSGKLSGDVFDPRKMDIRPLEVRCPAPAKQAALTQ
jgi:hypothetical protein